MKQILFCYAKLIGIGILLRRNILVQNNSSEARKSFLLLLRRRINLTCILILLLPSLAYAKSHDSHLTSLEIERLGKAKKVLFEVDGKSLKQSIAELERSTNPRMGLAIKEAMAKTYADIVSQEKVQDLHKKKWLYSMVALNMAYLQFEGNKDSAGHVQNLNKLIRYKLKSYLPADIFNQPGFRCSLG